MSLFEINLSNVFGYTLLSLFGNFPLNEILPTYDTVTGTTKLQYLLWVD